MKSRALHGRIGLHAAAGGGEALWNIYASFL
jgi:hypothetical protein